MVITFDQVIVFFLVFARFAGVFTFAPFLSDRRIMVSAKVALLFWLSGMFIFSVPLPDGLPSALDIVFLSIMAEFMIGVAIGFTADLLLTGIEFAGGLMDAQAGLSVATLLDPSSGINAALFQQFLKWVVVLLFIILNGHHMILSAVASSFKLLPIASPIAFTKGAWFLISLGKDIFEVAVILAAPIILVVFIIDFSFGILNRVAEQINVFQLGFQIKPIISLVIFLGITPSLMTVISDLIEVVLKNILILFGEFSV
jgi:flagellar biosynthetic protein FliR